MQNITNCEVMEVCRRWTTSFFWRVGVFDVSVSIFKKNPAVIYTNRSEHSIERQHMSEQPTLPVKPHSRMDDSQAREKILMELEMILTTVKQIDSNLKRSIALLESSRDVSNSKSYRELVVANTGRIREILELLGATTE